MVYLKNKMKNVQLAIGTVPTIFSLLFIRSGSWKYLLLCVVSSFVIIGCLPLFKKRQNLYMFIFVAIVGLPINSWLSYTLVSEGFISSGFLIGDVVWGALLFFVFLSIEEIVFGVITRMIWKKQYKIKIF